MTTKVISFSFITLKNNNYFTLFFIMINQINCIDFFRFHGSLLKIRVNIFNTIKVL